MLLLLRPDFDLEEDEAVAEDDEVRAFTCFEINHMLTQPLLMFSNVAI